VTDRRLTDEELDALLRRSDQAMQEAISRLADSDAGLAEVEREAQRRAAQRPRTETPGRASPDLGSQLLRWREARALSRKELGARAGVRRWTIASIERGRRRRVPRSVTLRLADALGLTGQDREAFEAAGGQGLTGHAPVDAPGHSRVLTPATPRELPRVRAIMTGPAGSGKTTQLAAMYHHLSLGSSSIRLQPADDKTSQALSAVVTRITHPERPEQPPATGLADTREWIFRIEARGRDTKPQPLFNLSYLDYAGEARSQPADPLDGGSSTSAEGIVAPQTKSPVEDFDILLGVLDGAKVAKAMLNQASGPELKPEIAQTVNLLTRAADHAVVHLLLTKWDEPASHGIGLRDVIAYLTRYAGFRELSMTRSLRLIPVSALGLEPYLVPGADGHPVRSGNRPWTPFNQELPVACAITDIVAASLQRLEASGTKLSTRILSVPTSPVFRAILDGLGLMAEPPRHPLDRVSSPAEPADLEAPVGMIIQAFQDTFRQAETEQALRERPLLALPGRQNPATRAATATLLAYCAQQTHTLELETLRAP